MNKLLPRWVPIVAIGAVLILAFSIISSARNSANSATGTPTPGKPAPSIEGKTHTGETFRLADYKGKVVLLNFWATWCGPCKAEIPDLIEVQKQYGDKGFTVVGISIDDSMPQLKDFAKIENINYPLIEFPKNDIRSDFNGLEFIPQSYLVDKNGNVIHSWEGGVTKEDLEAELKKLL